MSYAHSSAVPIFEAVDLDLAAADPAWVGVVGANGVGKSTLLRLMAGRLAPTVGTIVWDRPRPVVLVPQEVDVLTEDVQAFSWTWDGVAQRLRRRFHLDPDDLEGRWPTLSPGQRKRWQIAAALAQQPDVLLLDEPTNHLDVAARRSLITMLAGFTGLGLIVSHDRAVLEALTGRTLRLAGGTIELHAGSYGEAASRWRAEEQARRQAHQQARAEVARQQRLLAHARRERHSAEARSRRSRRMAGAAEPDAREFVRRFAQAKAEKSLARRVTQRNAALSRAQDRSADIEVARDHRGAVGFRLQASGRRTIATVVGDVAHAGGVLLRDVDVTLRRGDRVHLTGANGAGKTTLLRAVLRAMVDLDEQVAFLPQELEDPHQQVTHLHDLDREQRGRVLGIMARLGVDPDRLLRTERPSQGEARKLVLAEVLAGAAGVLVLDEPTNHLDLPSIERLEEALERWEGTLLIVTHDQRLADAVTDLSWQIEDGSVRVTRPLVPDDA